MLWYCVLVLMSWFHTAYAVPIQTAHGSHPDILFVEDLVNKAVIEYHSTHNGVNTQWDCDLCKIGVGLIQTLAEASKSWDDISVAMRYLCIRLQVQDETVCSDIVLVYKDEVLTVLDNLFLKPIEVCSFAFGDTCGTGYDPFQMWNVTLPKTPKPPVKPVPQPKKGSPTLRALHLSDIHIDMHYMEGSEAMCPEPICCRANTSHVVFPAGRWGTYSSCDMPARTLTNLFQHLSSHEKFDYIIWTGDLPAHYVWLTNKNDTQYLMEYLTQLLLKYFPKTPVYATLGNHEGVPVDSFPPDWKIVPANDSSKWLYESSAKSWLNWLSPDTLSTILRGGFYTALIQPGFRIVSLNMNMCNNNNWWLLLNMTDPLDQLQWFVQVLQRAEDNHEKVQIIGHIPPGVGSCVKAWSWNFYKIVNRYESTIVGQFYGHTHHDEYEIFYDPSTNFTRPTSVAYIAPSVVVNNGSGNSGYTVYTIDGTHKNTTSAVLDLEVHIFNLTEANKPGNAPVWYKEYSAKDAYRMKGLQPADWDQLLHDMQRDDQMFQTFYRYWRKSYSPDKCDAKCKQSKLCDIRSARSYDKELCRNYTLVYDDYVTHLYDSFHNALC